MKRPLLDISGKIDPVAIAIYELIISVAESQNIEFFIVGAAARDLVFHHGFDIAVRRKTNDIDLAVQVSDWSDYEALKNQLVETGQFTQDRITHRLQYKDQIPVDIVPFGAITETDGSISWPPDYAVRMNIIGFEDAYRDAMPVRLRAAPILDIQVASPASQAVLKLLSWKDRSPENTKDAIDLSFIIQNYLDVGNHERLHDEHSDLVDEDFDYVRTGTRLLGRDIATVLGEGAREVLAEILVEQTTRLDRFPLAEDMSRSPPAEDIEENIELLKYLKQGLSDFVGEK